MCIIIYKPANIPFPSDDIIKTCFHNNDDGAGIAFKLNNKVVIDKGYMTVEPLLKKIKKIDPALQVIIHFRLATSGGTSPEKCHPFPISDDEPLLNQLYQYSDIAMAHNGILGAGEKNLSDTQIFIRDELAKLKVRLFNDDVKEALTIALNGSNKVIIMSGNQIDPAIYGQWYFDKGVFYSNDGYKYKKSWMSYSNYNWKKDDKKTAAITDFATCTYCDGEGVIDNEYCPVCGGYGEKDDDTPEYIECEKCDGTGYDWDGGFCLLCNGEGYLIDDTLTGNY